LDAPEKSRGGDVESFYESLKELNEEKFCPFLKSCSVDLTRDYFLKICNTNSYASCQHFAKRLGELKTPINWLWKIAVERETSVQE
jgi:hypothetical protein